MTTYIEYTLEDGGTLLIEADEETEGAIKAADKHGNVIIKAEKMLKDALASVKQSVSTLRKELSELQADEVEVTFGIKTVGEVGLFAICKAGGEMNYEVKLHWARKE
jgi:Trypsin-co-occurring domain 1